MPKGTQLRTLAHAHTPTHPATHPRTITHVYSDIMWPSYTDYTLALLYLQVPRCSSPSSRSDTFFSLDVALGFSDSWTQPEVGPILWT